ncbi:MAG: hypothetical protein ACU85U_22740 [Gammaproteobacteria bacterium]|jgi:hypothetical protein
MAVGKEIGAFNMQYTSVTLEPGKDGSVTLHVNFEGSSSGDFACDALATMTVDSRNGKDGDYRISARCFMHDGTIVDANGEGKTVHGDGHKWSVAGITEVSGNRAYAIQGDIDLHARSFSGKMFERT